jgi:hypothetical protein
MSTSLIPVVMQTGHAVRGDGKPAITFNNMFSTNKHIECPAPKRVDQTQTPAMTTAAKVAISKIQEIQMKRKLENNVAKTNDATVSENKRLASSIPNNTASRMLPSGYVSGGSLGADSHSELLRLNGIIDSLNEKIKVQSQKLDRTEASLMKANQQITNERAAGHTRLMKANEHIRKLTENEAKLKSIANTIRDDQARSDETFKKSLQKFQESENNIIMQQKQLDVASTANEKLSDELAALNFELSRLSTERDAANKALEESTAKRKALEESSVQSDAFSTSSLNEVKAELEASWVETRAVREELESKRVEMGASIEALVQERDSLKAKLEEVTKSLGDEMSVLKNENQLKDASVTSTVSEKHALSSLILELNNKVVCVEKERDDALNLLSCSRRELQTSTSQHVDLKKIASDLAVTQSTLRESERERLNMYTRISMLESELGSTMTGKLKLKALDSLDGCRTIHTEAATSTATYTPNANYMSNRLKARAFLSGDKPAFDNQRSPKSVRTMMFERDINTDTKSAVSTGLKGCVANDPSSHGSKRFACNGHTHGRLCENMLSRDKALSTGNNPGGNKILENLVVAVSKDVVSAIVDARRSYMLASGIDEKDADQQLMPFAVSPIGKEDESK